MNLNQIFSQNRFKNFSLINFTLSKFINLLLISLAMLFSSACDKDQTYDKSKAVFAYIADDNLQIDNKLANQPIKLPPQILNTEFSGSLAHANQKIENFYKKWDYNQGKDFLKTQKEIKLTKSWSKSILYWSEKNENFHYQPVIFKQKLFVLDGSAQLFAFDLLTKKLIYKKQILDKSWLKNYRSINLSIDQDILYATMGTNHLVAVNAIDGKVIWQKQVSAVLNSKPITSDGYIYVSTDNNKTYCFNQQNGDIIWIHSGVVRSTAIFGSPEPLIYQDKVIVGYSSGEVYALNKKTAESIWVQDLNLNKAITSDFYLNDVDASLLVKNDIVYAIGNGGLLKAINVKNGQAIWKKQIAGIANFWLAGDYLFVINNDNKLIAINRNSAGIKWIKNLPDYQNPKKTLTKYIYNGLVMAGDKLVISRQDGVVMLVNVDDAKIEKTTDLGKKIVHTPLINNDKIYLQAVGRMAMEIIELM